MASISTHGSLTTSLVSYWSMDEASGTRVDAYGSNDLTANGTGGVAGSAGVISNGADFEQGDNDYLSISDASQSGLDITGDFSVAFWIKPESAPSASSEMLFGKWVVAGGQYFAMYRDIAGVKKIRLNLYDNGDGSNNVAVDKDIDLGTGTWKHFVITVDVGATDSVSEYWVNGVSQGTGTHAGVNALFTSTGQFVIGGGYAGILTDTDFDGMMDEFGIWTKVLSGTEITDLYNSGSGLPYSESSSTPYRRRSNLALLGVS